MTIDSCVNTDYYIQEWGTVELVIPRKTIPKGTIKQRWQATNATKLLRKRSAMMLPRNRLK
jgi:hypothetical protein